MGDNQSQHSCNVSLKKRKKKGGKIHFLISHVIFLFLVDSFFFLMESDGSFFFSAPLYDKLYNSHFIGEKNHFFC